MYDPDHPARRAGEQRHQPDHVSLSGDIHVGWLQPPHAAGERQFSGRGCEWRYRLLVVPGRFGLPSNGGGDHFGNRPVLFGDPDAPFLSAGQSVNVLRALLADRRRSQRGSVLSGVLIIVAFLAIIAGALMTELSTNFLLSNALVNRVGTEATVNSAAELALSQLQNTALNSGCPTPSAVTLNGQTAAVSVVSCAPVVDQRSLPALRPIASS